MVEYGILSFRNSNMLIELLIQLWRRWSNFFLIVIKATMEILSWQNYAFQPSFGMFGGNGTQGSSKKSSHPWQTTLKDTVCQIRAQAIFFPLMFPPILQEHGACRLIIEQLNRVKPQAIPSPKAFKHCRVQLGCAHLSAKWLCYRSS